MSKLADGLSEADWPVRQTLLDRVSEATVVLLSSGKSRSLEEAGLDARLLRHLAEDLSARGIRCVNPTLPLREDRLTTCDAGLIALRTSLAADAVRRLENPGPLAVVAVSLGVQSALALAECRETASRIDALILLSGVVEKPVAPRGRVRSVDLVYGARDYVAYLQEGQSEILLTEAPHEYGNTSRERIVLGPGQRCGLHILDGAGHALDCRGRHGADHQAARELVCSLIKDRLDLSSRLNRHNTETVEN